VAGSGSTVSIGDSTTCKVSLFGVCTVANTPLTQALLVYAPSSTVTVNTSACVLSLVCAAGVVDGSVIGNNVTITASTITEDLDLNNFPLYAGLNAFRPVQYIQCGSNNSSGRAVTSLSGTESTDTSGC
jgi:hypothetical protein